MEAIAPPTGISPGMRYPGTAPGSAAPPPPPPDNTPSTYTPDLRIRVANWMEQKFGKSALLIAMGAGGAVGAAAGGLMMGVPGALLGGAAGAMFGGAMFMAG